MNTHQVDVCIVGGGPAGMIMGLMLAKQGVQVLVLESHANFDREFRGEVLQPLFSQMMEQLNLLDYLQQYPHLKLQGLELYHKNSRLGGATFADVSPEIPYAIWMPQPILLQAYHDKASEFPSFDMWFHAQVKRLLHEEDQIVGVIVERDGQEVEVRARVTVGADGRFSTVRRLGQFEMEYEHYENDIIWFTTESPPGWDSTFRGLLSNLHTYLILPKYPDSIQGGIAMPKGEWKQIQAKGIEPFRQELLRASSGFRQFAESLTDFKPFFLLQARIMYVREWAKNGCLLVGDAAHCASPVGAIGVSLSVATALVAADVILDALKANDVSAKRLSRVQEIRSDQIRTIHALQIRGEKTAITRSKWVKRIRPYFIRLMMKTGLFPRFARRLFLFSEPLPINQSFRLTNQEAQKRT